MEQLENAEAYLDKDMGKQQPLPAELLEQAEDRFYDSFRELCGAHRRYYDEGKSYIGVKIGEEFGLFPPETEDQFHELGYNTLSFKYGGNGLVVPHLYQIH